MIRTKYFEGVEFAQAAQKPVSEMPPFDAERLRSKGIGARVITALLENPRPLLKFLRRRWPTIKLSRFALVLKNADVREILERQDVFETPFGPEMREMAGGADFVLGMQDGPDYRRLKSALLSAFPPAEVEKKVRPIAARHSREIMRHAMPGFDAVGELMKIVPVLICRDYYGMAIDDEKTFADWAIALSSLFFADFSGNAATRELAVVAAARMNQAIDCSIAEVRAGRIDPETPLARLVKLHDADPDALSENEIRSIMMGMITGFTPTNLLAAGNCLDVILSMDEAREAVAAAIAADDDTALAAAVMEAMRFKPINLGPLRYVARDTVIAKDTPREKRLRAGMTVWPSTLSAMFDEEDVVDPERFDPSRSLRGSLVFGHGIHWCVGAELAKVQIAEALKALFSKPGLRRAAGRAGRLTRRGAFPETLRVDFDLPPESRVVDNAFVTIAVPVSEDTSAKNLREMVDALGNPPEPAVREAFDRTGIIHFASLSVVGKADIASEARGESYHLVLEFSADGSENEAIDRVAAEAGAFLRPIFEAAGAATADADLAGVMRRHAVKVSPAPRHQPGLCFTGTPGHSVSRILAEDRLVHEAQAILAEEPADGPATPLERLRTVRDALAGKAGFEWAFQPAEQRLEGREGKVAGAVWALVRDPTLVTTLLLMIVAVALPFFLLAFGGWDGGFWRGVFAALAALVVGTIVLLAALGVLGWFVYARFRHKERSDPVGGAHLAPDRFEQISRRENHMAHNHLAAVSVMKPGLLRRLALRLGFFAILQFARHVFMPGRLADIGSIHYARWVLLPGTDKLLFFSNYGGSWGSYLEDFITKASKGLTAVWSNTEGFPRARNLFFDGATDGDRFKLWAREQQIPTLFWYSAYPELTTLAIRRNSSIRQAIASAETDTQAADWLDRFGSSPRPVRELEVRDIQSIVFGGMGKLEWAEMLAMSIPEKHDRKARAAWLDHLLENVSFGDAEPVDAALIVAFGPDGLRRLGLGGPAGDLATFPTAFRRGMANAEKARALGDTGDNASSNWDWGAEGSSTDVFFICYAANESRLKADVKALIARSIAAGIELVSRLPLTIWKNGTDKPHEHFGYRDGISQPVIAGTPRARYPTNPQHRVAAGEFLFGYRDEYGHLPPSMTLAAGADPKDRLPGVVDAESGSEDARRRDFGRNGSFLVVRQLVQHVDAFDAYCKKTAKALGTATIDGRPTEEWIGAKMLGRWKDGSSLVRNPVWRKDRDADNSFLFARDDPQGHRCPFGAHIRRSNPRDSLGGDPDVQIALSKRHRILRIGRTYERKLRGGKPEKGMLFMCLNADIERQFEFVQQSWVLNSGFEGLRNETDPLVGPGGTFTIPGPQGARRLEGLSAFTTVKGGGYFFMPGRRALRYLRSRT